MRLEARVVDPHLRGAGRAPAGEVEVGERRPVDVLRTALGKVVPGHPAVVLPDELLRLSAAARDDVRTRYSATARVGRLKEMYEELVPQASQVVPHESA